MEYAWLEPRHDPIATDTNLAEIDFENFKNEDLAYAFSCGEEESGGSSTDMSVCRSEPLFSSMRDSEMQSELNKSETNGGVSHGGILKVHGASGLEPHRGPTQDSLIQDSLTDEDFNFGEKVTVNKNNYTLTYSGQGVIGSFIASMVSSTGAILEPQDEELHHDGGPEEASQTGLLHTSSTRFNERSLDSPGKMITWSNLSKSPVASTAYQQSPPQPVIWQSRNREELNNNASTEAAAAEASRKTKSLPDFDVECKDAGRLVNAFIRGRNQGTATEEAMMRSKDTVNQYLKNNVKLTSIEEQIEAAGGACTGSSSSGTVTNSPAHTVRRPLSLPPKPQIKFLRKTKSLGTPKQDHIPSQGKFAYPSLDFLENDVGLWDTFFSHSKNSRFTSVLTRQAPPPALPIDEYLKNEAKISVLGEPPKQPTASEANSTVIYDSASLRALLPAAQKHLVPPKAEEQRSSPITQICQSLSKLHWTERSYAKNNEISSSSDAVQLVKVKQAWTEQPSEVVVRRRSRKKSEPSKEQRNLNLINNNNGSSEAADLNLKRRSYHPQDYLSQVLDPSLNEVVVNAAASSAKMKRRDFPKSGSQNDLVDSWRDEDESSQATNTSDAVSAANSRWNITANGHGRHLSAEYPFHKNLCMPPQGINFDLTHKRGLFVNLYSAVERLLMYQEDSSAVSNTSVKYILFHELCPALTAIMRDGLKPEVITSFGRMQTSVWRLVEALTRQGPSIGAGTATSDLVMLLNAKFAAAGEDHRKFSGFIAGLLNMSSLHVWFSKLKWNMDVLLRFYERHAFICALHKETRLLFDELLFCLQRLYSVPIHIDLPFSSEILDDIPLTSCSAATTPTSNSCSLHGCMGQKHAYDSSHCCCSNCVCSASHGSNATPKIRRPLSSKSRIPRPISLPKRLESKLSSSRSPVRPAVTTAKVGISPTTVRPTSSSDRKSRVRDTVKLFDSKTNTERRTGSAKRHSLKSPKTGAGEAMMALEDTGGSHSRR